MITGLITKATGGLYFVRTESGELVCKARGLFRNTKKGDRITPYVGDTVTVQRLEDGTGYITALDERKNFLIRPPLSNLDRLVIVVSTTDPVPSTLVIDKLLCICGAKGIEPVIVITKTDLASSGELPDIYRGFNCIEVSAESGQGLDELRSLLVGKLSGFTGNSGVGKSTLLNALNPAFAIDTGETSKKLGRGRHTTRHVELYPLEGGGYIADTPGFSSVELIRLHVMLSDELPLTFKEFLPYLDKGCRFNGCTHRVELGCRILEAVEQGEIPRSRHESYLMIYDEIKDLREWNIKR